MTTETRLTGIADLRDVLGIARRSIVYELLHHPRPDVSAAQYETTMHALHAAIAAHSTALTALVAERNGAGQARSGTEHPRIGALWGRLLRLEPFAVPAPGAAAGMLSEALERGRAYLAGLGLPVERTVPLYESAFAVDGAAHLEVLEHIVRDRIGVYGGAHGRHVAEQSMFIVSVRNAVGGDGESPGPAGRAAILYTTRRSGTPESFREEFGAALSRARSAGVPSLALWERKLGLGPGLDFTLRLAGFDDDAALAACLAALRGPAVSGAVRTAVENGALVVGRVLAD